MNEFKSRDFYAGKLILICALLVCLIPTGFAQTRSLSVAQQVALVTEFDVNGLTVLVKRRPNTPTVAAGLFIRGGARNIDAKNSGIENLALEVAAEGSKKFPREVLRRELSKTGSSIGASATNDYSVVSLASTLKDFDRSWDIFTDIAKNPAFDPADVDRVRKRILSSLKEEETDNDNFLNVLQNRIIYANHPYFNNVIGNLGTVGKFTADDLRSYHRKAMQTSRLLLVIVGDLDANMMRKKIAETLGELPRGSYVETPYPTLDFSANTLNVTPRTSLPTNYIRGVFNAPSLKNPDYYPMRVATTILNSRLFQEVRVKRQLSYAPSATLDSLSANSANIYVTAVDANQTVSVMLNVIKSLKLEPVRQEEIDGMAGQFLTNYYLKQETNAAQALELAKYELVGGGWKNAFEFLNRLRNVKSEDVQAVSQKYMKNIRFVVIGNPGAIQNEIFL
jgi:zinc protease